MPLTDNLVSYWKFSESSGNAADSVGSNTLTNSNVTYSTGKIGNGAVFNGTTSVMTTGAISVSGDASISLWFYCNAAPAAQYGWIASDWASPYPYLISLYYGDDIYLSCRNSTNTTTLNVIPGKAVPGNWYHIVFTRTSGTVQWYFNGSATGAGQVSNNPTITKVQLGINSANDCVDGTIDEVGLWSRALSSAEVTSLYNGGSGLQYPFSSPVSHSNLTTLGVG